MRFQDSIHIAAVLSATPPSVTVQEQWTASHLYTHPNLGICDMTVSRQTVVMGEKGQSKEKGLELFVKHASTSNPIVCIALI